MAVPARLASSRLPDKVLAEIGGKPMIQRVLEQCAKASGPAVVMLCTDSPRLQQLSEGWGFPVLMTSEDCSSGSERIASVADQLVARAWGEPADGWEAGLRAQRLASTAVINVQGDQPFLDPDVVTAMVEEFGRRDPVPAVVTPVYRLQLDTIHNRFCAEFQAGDDASDDHLGRRVKLGEAVCGLQSDPRTKTLQEQLVCPLKVNSKQP